MILVKASVVIAALVNSASSCAVGSQQDCADEASCVAATGVWVPVAPAINAQATAVQGGRRYTIGQTDEEFESTVSAPNGGYCTKELSPIPATCTANATQCSNMGDCFYRPNGGRWFHSDASEMCVSNCSDPLVYCDQTRCGQTLGCGWFILTQLNADQCYCIENPGIYGNPPPREKLSWIFWDQPVSIPIFVIAVIAALAILWNVIQYNIKPFFRKVFKPKPKE